MTDKPPPAVPGQKDDQQKDRWALLDWETIELVVKVLTKGAERYGANNWRHVENWKERYDSALERHLVAWRKGEWLDPDDGLPHLAHAACCLIFITAKELENQRHPLEVLRRHASPIPHSEPNVGEQGRKFGE